MRERQGAGCHPQERVRRRGIRSTGQRDTQSGIVTERDDASVGVDQLPDVMRARQLPRIEREPENPRRVLQSLEVAVEQGRVAVPGSESFE